MRVWALVSPCNLFYGKPKLNPLKNIKPELALFSSTFLLWGLVTVICNTLVSHYQEIYALDYKTVMLLLMAFFITRVIVSLPTSFVMNKIGYKATYKYALLWCVVGCLFLSMMVLMGDFTYLLIGVFVMASGITAVQVVCSPYVTLSADPSQSTQRQSVATALNSIGTIAGPILLTAFFVIALHFGSDKKEQQIALLFFLVAIAFAVQFWMQRRLNLPDIFPAKKEPFMVGLRSLVTNASFMKLSLVILLYIGGEVIFGTLTISYLANEELGGFTLNVATQLITFYWLGMLTGRTLLAKFSHALNVSRLFSYSCLFVIATSLCAIYIDYWAVGLLLLLIGLFNATIYPIVYSQALKAAGRFNSQGAAILIMCSVGGAIFPMMQASVIDSFGFTFSFWVPAVMYLLMLVLYYSSLKK